MFNRIRGAAWLLAAVMGTSGLALAQGGYYGGQDRYPDRYYDRGDYRYGRAGMGVARDIGFNDGARVGREDFFKGKRFQPYPRGKYSHMDRGYHREYGDKYAYQRQYARAYQEGYQRAFSRY